MNFIEIPASKEVELYQEALKQMYLRMIAYTAIPFKVNADSLTQQRQIISHTYLMKHKGDLQLTTEDSVGRDRYAKWLKNQYMQLSVSYKKLYKRALRLFHENQLNTEFRGNLNIWDDYVHKRIQACLNTYGEVVFKENLNRAIEGNIKAQIDIGKYYFLGWGTNVSAKEGLSWFKKAAQSNDSKALIAMGLAMESMSYRQFGIRACEDVEKIYARAFAMGETAATYYLFRYYDQFTVGKSGKIKSKRWLEKGLELGEPYCLFEAEVGLEKDQKWLPGHIETLMDWLQTAANMSLPGCLEVMGLVYFNSALDEKEV